MKNEVTIKGPDHDGFEQTAQIDAGLGAIKTIDGHETLIHQGQAFTYSYSTTTASTDDHRTGIAFTTPALATAEIHMTFFGTASHAAEITLSESPTLDSDPGANVTPLNRNRNSTTASKMGSHETTATVNEITTLTEAQIAAGTFTAGDQLAYEVMIAGGGPRAIGGASRSEGEWILKAATTYIVWIQNIGASANTQLIDLAWSEVC